MGCVTYVHRKGGRLQRLYQEYLATLMSGFNEMCSLENKKQHIQNGGYMNPIWIEDEVGLFLHK